MRKVYERAAVTVASESMVREHYGLMYTEDEQNGCYAAGKGGTDPIVVDAAYATADLQKACQVLGIDWEDYYLKPLGKAQRVQAYHADGYAPVVWITAHTALPGSPNVVGQELTADDPVYKYMEKRLPEPPPLRCYAQPIGYENDPPVVVAHYPPRQ